MADEQSDIERAKAAQEAALKKVEARNTPENGELVLSIGLQGKDIVIWIREPVFNKHTGMLEHMKDTGSPGLPKLVLDSVAASNLVNAIKGKITAAKNLENLEKVPEELRNIELISRLEMEILKTRTFPKRIRRVGREPDGPRFNIIRAVYDDTDTHDD